MTSITEEKDLESDSASSDDECLASLKRKSSNRSNFDEKRLKSAEGCSVIDSDDPRMPEVEVKIELEELDEEVEALEFGANDHSGNGQAETPWKSKKRRSWKCDDCNKEFEYSSELKKHAIEHQVETRHKCDECGKCLRTAFGLRTHKRMHGEKTLQCPLCDAKFALNINLGRHLSYHERRERCEQCDITFHLPEQVKQHFDTVHNPDYNPLYAIEDETTGVSTSDMNDTNASSQQNDSLKYEMDSESNGEEDPKDPLSMDYVTRERLNETTRCAIVSKMYKGKTVPEVCKMYNLTPEVVNEIWEDREQFNLPKKVEKRSLKYLNAILDERIVKWFHDLKSKGEAVTGKMLVDTAEAFAKECGYLAFNGSRKWLDRFKKRHGICFRSAPFKREYRTGQTESKWKNMFLQETWRDLRVGYTDDDIYTADEIGFYYNPSRGRIKKLGGKKFVHGYAKDRLAIFMCTNVTGNDKKKLVVCGTEDPLLHSHRTPDTLPVIYVRHAQAHFTTYIFEEYVKFWNRELQLLNRKVLLILDRVTIHSKLTLSNLKLVFVPWKATSSLMPIKNGIFSKLRDQYRRLIIEEKAMNAIKGIDRNLTCLEALNILDKAWERTPADMIAESFIITGYDIDNTHEKKQAEMPKVTDNDEEVLCKMLEDHDVHSYYTDPTELSLYLTVDEEFLTGQGSNGSVFGGNHKTADPVASQREKEEMLPLGTEKPETNEKERKVMRQRTIEDLEIVRKYLQSNDTTYETYCRFMDIEKFLISKPVLQ